jgi:hypothetical protein
MANHGVRFTEPTQIPIKLRVNLMQPGEVSVVEVNKPEHFMVMMFFMEIGNLITLRMAGR